MVISNPRLSALTTKLTMLERCYASLWFDLTDVRELYREQTAARRKAIFFADVAYRHKGSAVEFQPNRRCRVGPKFLGECVAFSPVAIVGVCVCVCPYVCVSVYVYASVDQKKTA